MQLQPWQVKTEVVRAIRTFFEAHQFQEVITPVLQTGLPLEPTLFAFETAWHTQTHQQKLYLSTSPESSLKKMLAQGSGNCFAVSHCFRNLEGSGDQHQPEFLMLEWYRENATMQDILIETQKLMIAISHHLNPNHDPLKFQGHLINLEDQWPQMSLVDLFQQYAEVDLLGAISDQVMSTIAKQKGYQTKNATWEELFNQIFLNEVEPHLPWRPFFLVDFPARISPLCQPQAKKPNLADRFELYIAHMEIGNGNQENLDRQKIEPAFARETQLRQTKKVPIPVIDTDFLDSLEVIEQQKTNLAGIGLGIDRLAMLFSHTSNIQDVNPLAIKQKK